jgi:hypothetical protein
MCFKKFKEDFMQILSQKSRILSFCSDGPYLQPDAHQCLKDSNCSSLHPSGHCSNMSERSSEFEKNPEFIVHPSRRRGNTVWTLVSVRHGRQVYTVWTLSLIRQDMEKNCNHPDVRATPFGSQSLLWKLRTAEVQQQNAR